MKSYRDIVGDGGSRIVEQVAEQRERITARLAGVKRIVAVGSGKGGVGKSTLTVLLATYLAGEGRHVAILDADFNGPSQARLAGLGPTPLVPAAGGLPLPRNSRGLGVISLGALVPETDAVDFPAAARGDSHVWRATREFTALGQLLAAVEWGALDYLLVDLPPGAERTFQYAEFLGARTAFVLVTVPSALARGVVARSVAALAPTDNPLLGYVENMSGYFCRDCGSLKPLFPDGDRAAIQAPLLGRVPFDPDLAAACDRGAVPQRSGPAWSEIGRVAERLAEAPEGGA